MRTNILLVSLVAMLAACSEQQQPTSPNTAAQGVGRPAGDVGAGNAATPGQQAKPVDQVGFTKVAMVFVDGVIPAGQAAGQSANCPAGSFATGGGYQFYVGNPAVQTNRPAFDPPRAWLLAADNTKSATDATVRVWVLCVS